MKVGPNPHPPSPPVYPFVWETFPRVLWQMRLLYKLNYQWYNAMHTETIKRSKIITKLITFNLGLVMLFNGGYIYRTIVVCWPIVICWTIVISWTIVIYLMISTSTMSFLCSMCGQQSFSNNLCWQLDSCILFSLNWKGDQSLIQQIMMKSPTNCFEAVLKSPN